MLNLNELLTKAKKASKTLEAAKTEDKNKAILAIADELLANRERIIEENKKDIEKAEKNGMNKGLIDRLTLTDERIAQIAEGVRQVAKLNDPIGEVISQKNLPNGLNVIKRRVPLGVVGVIYESRPNVTVDTAVLCLKASNAVVLRGGSDAFLSNKVLSSIMRCALEKSGFCPNCISFVEDTSRETATELMKKKEFLDVLIPRGGAGLIRSVVENATVPVIETGVGNCHIYVDKDFQEDMAIDIIINAKCQRPSVCNACESLLVHKSASDTFFKRLEKELKANGVEIRGCKKAMQRMHCDKEATDADFDTEFLSLILSVKIVDDLTDALEHIEKYSTRHSECIITNSSETAEKFLESVDAAAVYVNASTRFTDGFEFGLGAEIGISTQKLHARGPMGIEELTTYKYNIIGEGQIR